MLNKTLKFPVGFLWGVSTSAYQVEGGINNDWSRWERGEARIRQLAERFPPEAPARFALRSKAGGDQPRAEEKENKNPTDFICGQACDSYNRYEEDLNLVKNLNCGAYRIGLEWARLEPEQGKFNQGEIRHYRKVLLAFKEKGVKSVVTLWHWTSPLWFSTRGGWQNSEAVKYFSSYTEVIVKELGDLIDYWLTINEPMVYLSNGYVAGKWPPNKRSIFRARQAFGNLIKAHKQSHEIIHQPYPKAKVGLTMLVNYFEPAKKWNLIEIFFSKLANYFWNDRFIKKLNGHYDFLGLDYYFHDRIIWHLPFKKNLNQEVSDLGWEIYPSGIYEVIKNYAKFKKPLFIMENGLADESDSKREKFITEHLRHVYRAIQDGLDVRGYFHWSLLDNFEWLSGFGPKFGLYSVDRKTFVRTPRPSARLYSEICKNNQVRVE